jgi:uncharacterized protein YxjI
MIKREPTIKYPLKITGKILAVAPQFSLKDGNGKLMLYVRQKIFTLRDRVSIYRDQAQTDLALTVTADRIFDYNACFDIKESMGPFLGTLERRGTASLWRATYEIYQGTDTRNELLATITEVNPWVKVLDTVAEIVPILGPVISRVANPTYILKNAKGYDVYRIKKDISLFERQFSIYREGRPEGNEKLFIASILTMIVIENHRG